MKKFSLLALALLALGCSNIAAAKGTASGAHAKKATGDMCSVDEMTYLKSQCKTMSVDSLYCIRPAQARYAKKCNASKK